VSRSYDMYVDDVIQSCQNVIEFTTGLAREEFLNDKKLDPVSTMTQRSINGSTESRPRVITCASSFTIMFRHIVRFATRTLSRTTGLDCQPSVSVSVRPTRVGSGFERQKAPCRISCTGREARSRKDVRQCSTRVNRRTSFLYLLFLPALKCAVILARACLKIEFVFDSQSECKHGELKCAPMV
jgi:hypothetical protein